MNTRKLQILAGVAFVFGITQPAVASSASVLGYFQTGFGSVNESYNLSGATSASGSTSAGIAVSSGDLATGQLHAYAASPSFGAAAAQVTLDDTLHFIGTLPAPLTLTLSALVDGILTPSACENITCDFGQGPVVVPAPTAGGSFAMGVSDASIPSTAVRAAFQDTNCFPSDPNCFNGLTVNRGFDVQFTITDVSRTVPIEIFLGGYSSDGGVANFANTATLSLSLPDGISFTSDSGVFLSAAVTPPTTSAPEPSSLALMALGTLAVSAFRKRRNLASAAKHRE